MAQAIAIKENFADLYDPKIKKIYDNEVAENVKSSMIDMLFERKSPTGHDYAWSSIGAMGDLQDFDGQIDYDGYSQGYDTTVTFPEKALGFKIERILVDDAQWGKLEQKPRQMGYSVARSLEKKAASIFNNGFTETASTASGVSGGDGVSLFSTAHPYSPDDSTTQSNKGTSALSAVSVEATRRIGKRSILNDRGDLLEINYDTILCTTMKEQTASEIYTSDKIVDSAYNNTNFLKGKFNVVVWDRLSNDDNWFMIDSRLSKMFLMWFDRIKAEFKRDGDFDTYVAKYAVYARYNCWYGDWRPFYGHLVS